jgi:hypothetical protein
MAMLEAGRFVISMVTRKDGANACVYDLLNIQDACWLRRGPDLSDLYGRGYRLVKHMYRRQRLDLCMTSSSLFTNLKRKVGKVWAYDAALPAYNHGGH